MDNVCRIWIFFKKQTRIQIINFSTKSTYVSSNNFFPHYNVSYRYRTYVRTVHPGILNGLLPFVRYQVPGTIIRFYDTICVWCQGSPNSWHYYRYWYRTVVQNIMTYEILLKRDSTNHYIFLVIHFVSRMYGTVTVVVKICTDY